jgi:hypothetical protein
MQDLNVFYIVCGDNRHYLNLQRSLKSLSRITSFNKKISIFDMSVKVPALKLTDEISVIPMKDVDKTGFYHHRIWRAKYEAALSFPEDNELYLYVDTDVVLVNDNLLEISNKIGENIGVTRHFWVPSFYQFINSVSKDKDLIEKSLKELGIKNNLPFVAGGIFLFRNNAKNRAILTRVLELYDEFYTPSKEYVNFITDETFLSIVLNEFNNNSFLNGAFNHCSMLDMPLSLIENNLYGRNPFDDKFEKVTAFHCDCTRRDPSLQYTGELKDKVREAFYL